MVFPKSRASWRMSAFAFHKKHHRNFFQRMGEAPEASEASQASEARDLLVSVDHVGAQGELAETCWN